MCPPYNPIGGRGMHEYLIYLIQTIHGSYFRFIGWMFGLSASIKFSGKRDLIIQDDCDKTVTKICEINESWSDELASIEVQVLEA
jgi:hypothetical protein